MCGFFVIFKKKKFKIDKKKFITSAKLISHRGPDKTGEYFDDIFYSKFYRLSILDKSQKGMQPMFSKDKRYLLLFNGEIYNSPILRKKIDSKIVSKNSDTEVLLNYLIKYKDKALNLLDGMFSFVFYDKIKKELLIGRDRFGIKPLYYHNNDKYLILSSEIKPILRYEEIYKTNNETVANFFFKGSMDHKKSTFFNKIYSLEPSNYIFANQTSLISKNYWQIKNSKISYNKDIDKEIPRLKKLINESVKKHLLSDFEVGLFLSGGTDSTALAYLITKNTKKNLRTFTYGFSNQRDLSEISTAEKTVSNLKIKNYSIYVNEKDVISKMDNMVNQLESPFTSIRLFGIMKLYKIVKTKKIKVIIEGDGGDEIMGGYDYNYLPFLLDEYKDNKKIDSLINNLNKFIKNKNKHKLDRIKYFRDFFISNSFQNGSTSDGTPYIDLTNFNTDFVDEFINEQFYKEEKNYNLNNLQKSQYLDINFLKLPRSLKYKDRLSMSHGIETRLPFLDHHLSSYCYNLPNNFKIKNQSTRYIFKETIKNISGKKIKFNNTKKTIVDPQSNWLKNGLRDFAFDTFSSRSFKKINFFNQANLLKNFEYFCKKDNVNSFPFFQILTYYYFNKNFIEKYK